MIPFFAITVYVNAQTYTISKSVNIFGDTIQTYKDGNGRTIAETKESTDIFGKKTRTTTGPNGEKIRSVSKSTDIFGNEVIEKHDGRSNSTITITFNDMKPLFLPSFLL